MKYFNLNNIIAAYSLDTDKLAKVLFPSAKYSKLALDRILKGEASLSVDQLEKLAAFIGVMPSELFMLDTWKDASENGLLMFKKGVFLVKLNHGNTFLTLYKNEEAVTQEFIDNGIGLSDFIKYIDDLITKY